MKQTLESRIQSWMERHMATFIVSCWAVTAAVLLTAVAVGLTR